MQHGKKILAAVLVFVCTYLLFLVLWIQIKPYYGTFLSTLATQMVSATTNFRLINLEHGKEEAEVTFSRPVLTQKGIGDLLVDLTIPVSNYSFNVPLTFALVAGLFILIRWRKKHLLEAALILLFIHFLYVYFYCMLQLFYHLAQGGFKVLSEPVQLFLEFMWAFTDNMVIRFEPFLIGAYLWLRNMKASNGTPQKRNKKLQPRRARRL